MNVVAALAGRRPDPVGQHPARFPLLAVPTVRVRVRALFETMGIHRLVSSAACGADLIALDIAGDLELHRTVILPFGIERFRESSVVDRPGDWGPLFDRIVDEASARGCLRILNQEDEDAGYEAVTRQLVNEAFSAGTDVVGVAVWEGVPSGVTDETARLLQLVEERGGRVREVSTLV